MNVQRTASLHEKTVQECARGVSRPSKQRRRTTPRLLSVTTREVTVRPDLLSLAMKQAGGDASRLKIVDENEVIVLNNKKGR